MKLITWNCQGAFRKKADIILLEQPDLLIVPECEHPDNLVFSSTTRRPDNLLWIGDNKHKGLGIFSFNNYKLKLLDQHNAAIKFISPISVTGGKLDFILFAIWANNRNDPDGQYVEQIWKAIEHYDQLLSEGPTILTGDFNSNKIWDKPKRIGNHSQVVDKLTEKNIYSVYHRYQNQEQGKESHPTFYLQRKKEKPYHIDYCFASEGLYNKVKSFEIGSYENWITHSDHAPLIVSFNI